MYSTKLRTLLGPISARALACTVDGLALHGVIPYVTSNLGTILYKYFEIYLFFFKKKSQLCFCKPTYL